MYASQFALVILAGLPLECYPSRLSSARGHSKVFYLLRYTLGGSYIILTPLPPGSGAVYSFDPVGSYEREACRAAGAAQSLVQPFLDNQVRVSRAPTLDVH